MSDLKNDAAIGASEMTKLSDALGQKAEQETRWQRALVLEMRALRAEARAMNIYLHALLADKKP